MRYLILFLLLTGFVTASYGQDSKLPPLPKGILLKRVPDYSTWTMAAQGAVMTGNGGGPQDSVMQSKVVKAGSIILEENTDLQGKAQATWHIKDLRIVKPSEGNNVKPIISRDSGGGDIYSVNFAVSDFAGLDWISANTYAGIRKYQGRDCIIFKGEVSPLPLMFHEEELVAIENAKTYGLAPPEEKKVAAVAYIDLETRLPLLVQFGNQKRVYQYSAPVQPLTLPPDIADAVKAYIVRLQVLSAPIPKA